jgi:hypothetical protein
MPRMCPLFKHPHHPFRHPRLPPRLYRRPPLSAIPASGAAVAAPLVCLNMLANVGVTASGSSVSGIRAIAAPTMIMTTIMIIARTITIITITIIIAMIMTIITATAMIMTIITVMATTTIENNRRKSRRLVSTGFFANLIGKSASI